MPPYAKDICKGLIEGKYPCHIAKEIGKSGIWVKKLIAEMVKKGIIVRNPPYTINPNYEEMLKQ